MERLELLPRDTVEGKVESTSVSTSDALAENEEVRTVRKGEPGSRRNPPARNTSRFWFERFLAVIQRQNPSLIDSSFLSQIAPNNEGKLLAQLKFLRLIDEQGKPTALLPALNMVGSEQKKGFQQVIRESYGELLAEIVVEKAVADDVVNYFIRRYAFTRDKAIFATKFFLYLAEKGSLGVSPELSSFLSEKSASSQSSNGSSQPLATAMGSNAPRVVAVERTSRSPSSPYSLSSKGSKRPLDYGAPVLQTVINIRLDKDTPREYWDRVLALAGERRADAQLSAEQEEKKGEISNSR